MIKKNVTYVKGEFFENQPHGQADYVRKEGERYSGNWKHGKKHGLGKEIVPEGTTYEGNYVNGKRYDFLEC